MVNRRHGRTGSCDKGFSLGLAAGHSKRDRYTLEKEKTTRRAMLYSGPRKYRGRSTVTPTQLQPKRRDLSAAMADRRDRPSPAIPNHRTVLRKMVEGKVDRSLRAKIRTRSSRSHRRRPGGNTLPRRIGDPDEAEIGSPHLGRLPPSRTGNTISSTSVEGIFRAALAGCPAVFEGMVRCGHFPIHSYNLWED
ncbi:hypothetical protein ADUPG1_011141 [Aduncisulcus paluster]|uniref:Uncharacterized protein n=1 Tax=Aduncisulcus paluster TaxID=2918883 RepID=A0ABQ5JYF3_9EUKA|nr:hypothetical protein ADUPG1_011141 [Aduncisulcus paluster]